ncbi:MAG: hypothetical protein NTY83_02295 [Candidatus Micrarchaeota archaeon]|nr:hypothetical protein [Candidatus Micrarchaeota archaeon]
MHSIRADAPKMGRRDLLRGALASAVLLAIPSCVRGNGGPSIVSANNGKEIPLFLGSNTLSQDSLANMRNDVGNLRGLLEKLMDTARRVSSRREFDFSGCRNTARVSLELADDFMSESENPAPGRMDYLNRRWEFVHSQLVDSIRRYRDGLVSMGIGTRVLGQEFGIEIGDI